MVYILYINLSRAGVLETLPTAQMRLVLHKLLHAEDRREARRQTRKHPYCIGLLGPEATLLRAMIWTDRGIFWLVVRPKKDHFT